MPIILATSRRSPKVRLLVAAIYVILLGGAATMVYPFLLMVSGSTKSDVDIIEHDVVPRFLYDDAMLYRKHIEGVFQERAEFMAMAYDSDAPSFRALQPPAQPNRELVAEWRRFLDETALPDYAYTCGYTRAIVTRTNPKALREFKQMLTERYDGDIGRMNRALGVQFGNWYRLLINAENYLPRRNMPQEKLFERAFAEFKSTQPPGNRYYFSPEGFFKKLFLKTAYSNDIKEYNQEHGTSYGSYAEVHLARRAPRASAKERKDWEEFVRYFLNLLWLRAEPEAAPVYREFLRAKYLDVATLNRNYGARFASFDDVPLVEEPPLSGIVLSDWEAFVTGWRDPDTEELHVLPLEAIRVHSVEFMFRDYLRARHRTVGALNAALETSFVGYVDATPPQRDAHYFDFVGRKGELRWEFVTRNYRLVIDYILVHGRGIVNTVIYCTLAVLFALLVNPLAAYALSRYRMRSAYKILLFLMLTMAFPPMVTQIPIFIMLREFHLLNTFAALLLPGLANGYLIFLLKGFFDSLPRELYESAEIDGAGEWTMFWGITMSLSKPILAVVALGSFTVAYSNFMFALLLCQDDRMWTLMVWLFQLGQITGKPVMYAALIIAAIPTFVIFVFCQNIIMRGIVVPVEK